MASSVHLDIDISISSVSMVLLVKVVLLMTVISSETMISSIRSRANITSRISLYIVLLSLLIGYVEHIDLNNVHISLRWQYAGICYLNIVTHNIFKIMFLKIQLNGISYLHDLHMHWKKHFIIVKGKKHEHLWSKRRKNYIINLRTTTAICRWFRMKSFR